jgi:hypothetical protein
VQLFSTSQRTDQSRKKRSETPFNFLDRSSEPSAVEVRKRLESWFAHYPSAQQQRLRCDLEADGRFYSASFELFLHEIFNGLNYKISVDPVINNRTPDFLIEKDGIKTIVEATSAEDGSLANLLLEDLIDYLRTHLPLKTHSVEMTVHGSLPNELRRSNIRDFLYKELSELTPVSYKKSIYKCNSRWKFDFCITPDSNPGFIWHPFSGTFDVAQKIKKTIRKKVRRYSALPEVYFS